MLESAEEVRHDAATLHRFIDSITADCKLIDSYPCYVSASHDFFLYINQVADATKTFLQEFIEKIEPDLASKDSEQFYSRSQVLRTIRLIWFELHQFVKPALDADTLHAPYALVDALTTRIHQIEGFEQARFAVFHTSQLNYFQIGATGVRNFAEGISKVIPGAPPFPENLGIILLPYSQSASVFLNLALAHEMGHHSFQERKEGERLSSAAIAAVQEASKQATLSPLDLVWCKDRVLDWCEEIYCDLFALWLVGPCFSLSFVELFAYTRLAPTRMPDGSTNSPLTAEAVFSDSHPAPAFRLGEHVRFMKDSTLSWWHQLSERPNHYVNLLLEAEKLQRGSFTYNSRRRPECAPVVMNAFWGLSAEIHRTVKGALARVPVDADSFGLQRADIEDYLSFGVVPSRLVTRRGIEAPTVVALLNASSLFYLDGLDRLIKRVSKASSNCLYCRTQWGERVEMWTTKALEDLIRL